ncbi:hypothetical protein [Allostreptomyces psammosilenae]|uniref:Uncharacterized protein n=1 Tax=Allostreptomyces psammosilenae TaxID=1892865 RepID=A0A852ZM00_9ACTN|nr:hypothetical protein [Allostreptomyces psammosilenae]NYI03436.1 hypothetical protein [Allostreptomyces psammosilenae]
MFGRHADHGPIALNPDHDPRVDEVLTTLGFLAQRGGAYQLADPSPEEVAVAFGRHPTLGVVAAVPDGEVVGQRLLERHGFRHRTDLDIFVLPEGFAHRDAVHAVARVTTEAHRHGLVVAADPRVFPSRAPDLAPSNVPESARRITMAELVGAARDALRAQASMIADRIRDGSWRLVATGRSPDGTRFALAHAREAHAHYLIRGSGDTRAVAAGFTFDSDGAWRAFRNAVDPGPTTEQPPTSPSRVRAATNRAPITGAAPAPSPPAVRPTTGPSTEATHRR